MFRSCRKPITSNSDEAPSAPALAEASALTLDTIEQRYPLLRNAL